MELHYIYSHIHHTCTCSSYFSHVRLFVTPWTICSPSGSSVHGFSRQEYWSELPFPSPGDLLDPGIKPMSPALQADSLPSEPPGKSMCHIHDRISVYELRTHWNGIPDSSAFSCFWGPKMPALRRNWHPHVRDSPKNCRWWAGVRTQHTQNMFNEKVIKKKSPSNADNFMLK